MHVCLFDIDGTMLHTGGAGKVAMEMAIQELLSDGRPIEGISTAGRTDRSIASDLFEFYNKPFNEESLQQFHDTYLQRLPAVLADLEGEVLPGVVEILETLTGRDDVLVGLLTGNFREGAKHKLSRFDINHYFSFGGFGDLHHHRDDVAREALAEIEQRVEGDVDTSKVWVIGDTPADVQCGRAIGANVVAVATGIYTREQLQPTDPDCLWDDLSDTNAFYELLN